MLTDAAPAADVCAIVLAAGQGNRYGGPKQFALAGGRRLVDHAVETAGRVCGNVVVVVPPGHDWDGAPVTAAVAGGPTRTQSVRAALAAAPDGTRIVVIHDAAHPLAGRHLFAAVVGAVRAGAAAAIPALPLGEPLKLVEDGLVVGDVVRVGIQVAQTPHAFRVEVLRAAHALGREVVEDTLLVAALGETIAVVAGDPRNIHVTTPDELDLVRRLIDAVL